MEPRFLRTHMHINLHPVERWIRVIIGAVLVLMAFAGGQVHGWYLLGAVPLLTGLIGFCPIYYALNFNTNRWARVKVDPEQKRK